MEDNKSERYVVVEGEYVRLNGGAGFQGYQVVNADTNALLGWNLPLHVAESTIAYKAEVAREAAAAREHREILAREAIARDAQTLAQDPQALEREARKLARNTQTPHRRHGPERGGGQPRER